MKRTYQRRLAGGAVAKLSVYDNDRGVAQELGFRIEDAAQRCGPKFFMTREQVANLREVCEGFLGRNPPPPTSPPAWVDER